MSHFAPSPGINNFHAVELNRESSLSPRLGNQQSSNRSRLSSSVYSPKNSASARQPQHETYSENSKDSVQIKEVKSRYEGPESAFLDAESIPVDIANRIRRSKEASISRESNNATPDRNATGSKFFKDVEPHQFTVDGSTYEWTNGVYYRKVNEKYDGDSFGQDALLQQDDKAARNATIKTMDDVVHFAVMTQANFKSSLQKLESKKLTKKIEFLQNIPCFKSQTRKAIMKYSNYLKPMKFSRGQTVYQEGQPANAIYIVNKGEFELAKKLPRADRAFDGANLNTLGSTSGNG